MGPVAAVAAARQGSTGLAMLAAMEFPGLGEALAGMVVRGTLVLVVPAAAELLGEMAARAPSTTPRTDREEVPGVGLAAWSPAATLRELPAATVASTAAAAQAAVVVLAARVLATRVAAPAGMLGLGFRD